MNAQTLINDGTAAFQAGTTSTAQRVVNSGTLNVFGDAAGDVGSLTAGTLRIAGGVITVYNNGGLLVVGSGTAPAGFTGYDQLANGVLEAAGGVIDVLGPALLNGTLDIMLGNGYKPIGTVFTILNSGYPGLLTGTFSSVEGSVFDGGRERYALTYLQPPFGNGSVFLTVENNTTPEPGSILLVGMGLLAMLMALLPPTWKYRR